MNKKHLKLHIYRRGRLAFLVVVKIRYLSKLIKYIIIDFKKEFRLCPKKCEEEDFT